MDLVQKVQEHVKVMQDNEFQKTKERHCNEVHLNYVKCIIVYTHITLALYRLD